MHSSWGEGQIEVGDDGTLEAVIDASFSNRAPDRHDKQIVRLMPDGSIQVVLLTWGGYVHQLDKPFCFDRHFFTGTLRESNGIARVVILLDLIEGDRSIFR